MLHCFDRVGLSFFLSPQRGTPLLQIVQQTEGRRDRAKTGSVLNLAWEDEAVLWQYVCHRGGGSSCNDFVRAGLL